MCMDWEAPDWFENNRLAIALIGVAVLVSLVLVVLANTGQAPATDTAPNETAPEQETNFSEQARGNQSRIGGDADDANRTHMMNITRFGLEPFSVSMTLGDAVRLNNQNDVAVVIDWEDEDSGANVTIEAGGSYETRVRGTEYFTAYPQSADAPGPWSGQLQASEQ